MQGMEPGADLSQSQVLSQRVMNDCTSHILLLAYLGAKYFKRLVPKWKYITD